MNELLNIKMYESIHYYYKYLKRFKLLNYCIYKYLYYYYNTYNKLISYRKFVITLLLFELCYS